jgi:hypothetical protein
MSTVPRLHLGNGLPTGGEGAGEPLLLPAHHFVTHAVIVGMTGSGKTGLFETRRASRRSRSSSNAANQNPATP